MTPDLTPLLGWLRDVIRAEVRDAVAEAMASTSDPDALIPADEAARESGVGQRTIRDAVAGGELEAHRPGRRLLVRRSDVRAWVERKAADKRAPRARAVADDDWAGLCGLEGR